MRILLTVQPLVSHLLPILPLACAMKRAGHRVAVASTAELRGVVCAAGLEMMIVAPAWESDPTVLQIYGRQPSEVGQHNASFILQSLFVRAAIPMALAGTESAVNRYRPHAIICDPTEFCGRIVGERHGIPVIVVSFGTELTPELAVRWLGDSLNEYRITAGLPADVEHRGIMGNFSLCIGPPSYTQRLSGADGANVAPVAYDQCDDYVAPRWLGEMDGRPVLYLTLGNSYGRIGGWLARLQTALASLDVDLVVTGGRGNAAYLPESVTCRCHVAEYVPHSQILPRCAAVICHAGFGTVMDALRHGLPLVLMPIGADNFLHAARCEAVGAGITIPLCGDDADQAARDAVTRLLEFATYRDAAQRLRDEISAMPPLEDTVLIVEAQFN